jgi:hypothetical protein
MLSLKYSLPLPSPFLSLLDDLISLDEVRVYLLLLVESRLFVAPLQEDDGVLHVYFLSSDQQALVPCLSDSSLSICSSSGLFRQTGA